MNRFLSGFRIVVWEPGRRTALYPLLLALTCAPSAAAPQPKGPDRDAIAEILGRAGTLTGDVYRVTFPRTDLRVQIDGVTLHPPLALTSWVAFRPVGEEAVVTGDLVLTQEEINPVISALEKGGIDVTALHNHLLSENPRLMFLHLWGQGEAVTLARALRVSLQLTSTESKPEGEEASRPDESFPTQSVEGILGQHGRWNAGVFQVSVPRSSHPDVAGVETLPAMGMATAINWQPVGSEAFTTGDFVLLPAEVNPVVRALRDHGLQITAIHNHMLGDHPQMIFLHFWGRATPEQLARGLRAALDQLETAEPTGAKPGVEGR